MSNIWFTSDTHYGHKNLVKGTTSWDLSLPNSENRVRDFASLEEHNQKLVDIFNSLIKPDDILYHLGDWSFGGHDNIYLFRKQLHCKNIHLILGNHDYHIENDKFLYNAELNARSLFSSVDYVKTLKLKGVPNIFMSHYAHRVWDKSHHGSIHLYGHSHGTLPDAGNRSMDVGVDTHNLYPYHLDEILETLLPRKVEFVDHHNQNTN